MLLVVVVVVDDDDDCSHPLYVFPIVGFVVRLVAYSSPARHGNDFGGDKNFVPTGDVKLKSNL